MTQPDYMNAKRILSNILLGDIDFEDKLDLTKDLQLLDLDEYECILLHEYIDKIRTDYNILCCTCRDACKKSELR